MLYFLNKIVYDILVRKKNTAKYRREITMTYQYKGFTIKKVTRVDYVVYYEDGKIHETMTPGNIPRTLKAAKARIDNLKQSEV